MHLIGKILVTLFIMWVVFLAAILLFAQNSMAGIVILGGGMIAGVILMENRRNRA